MTNWPCMSTSTIRNVNYIPIHACALLDSACHKSRFPVWCSSRVLCRVTSRAGAARWRGTGLSRRQRWQRRGDGMADGLVGLFLGRLDFRCRSGPLNNRGDGQLARLGGLDGPEALQRGRNGAPQLQASLAADVQLLHQAVHAIFGDVQLTLSVHQLPGKGGNNT